MITAFNVVRYAQFGPTLLILCLAVGSVLLWSRTRRVSTLLQFISTTELFVFTLLFNLRSILVSDPFHPPLWARILSSDVVEVAQVFGVVAFPIGYLWYAIQRKNI
jgi:hypothetical protein